MLMYIYCVYVLLCTVHLVPQEFEECSSDGKAVVLIGDASHAITVQFVCKDADRVAVEKNLGDNVLCELGVPLHGNVLAGSVHGLHGADIVAAEGHGIGREVGDDVGVHLVDSLVAKLAL